MANQHNSKIIVGSLNVQNIFTAVQSDFIVKAAEINDYINGKNHFQQPINLLGMQETRTDLIEILKIFDKTHTIVGKQRYKGIMQNTPFSEGNHIAVKNNSLSIEDTQTTWLSPKIQSHFGFSYLAPLPRIATYALVSTKENNDKILMINTHLHYIKGYTQRKQLERLQKLLESLRQIHQNAPMILTGDLNLEPNDYDLRNFEDKISDYLTQIKIDGSTYHKNETTKHLDYIFTSSSLSVEDAVIDRESHNVGDHYPVVAKIKIK